MSYQPTVEKHYSRGYQAALEDIAQALNRGGVHGAFDWIYDNSADAETRAIIRHLTRQNPEN